MRDIVLRGEVPVIALTVIVAAGILFLLRVLFAFWQEAATQSHKPVVAKMDSKINTTKFIAANDSTRVLTFEPRLRNAAVAANDAELVELRSSKRAF